MGYAEATQEIAILAGDQYIVILLKIFVISKCMK